MWERGKPLHAGNRLGGGGVCGKPTAGDGLQEA